MGRELILAHDLGTSGDKACIFDANGNFLAEAYNTYDTYYPQEGYAEHNPASWWEAMKNATNEVVTKAGIAPGDVKAISFSAHGMGAMPIDKAGNLLVDRVMVWMDARSTREAADILERTGEREHYEKTGNSFDIALYPAAKTLWIKRNMPDVYKKTYKFISTKEYLIHKMTGVVPQYTDYGEAGMSGLFNMNTRQWDEELIAASEIDGSMLLEPCDATKIIGELTEKAAAELGLAKGTAVVQGSWDNYACATGAGVRKDGTLALCLGTAGWMGINHTAPLISKDFMSNVVYVGDGKYFTSAHSHSACVAYDWVLNNMCKYLKNEGKMFEKADELASQAPAGAEKLFFMPSMFAGNTFYSDAALCGSFVGLKMLHDERHILRAAMEGVGFDLMMGADFFKSLGAMPKEANIIGGGAKSDLWMQIMASMCGVTMTRPKNLQHIGALGAALFAGVGVGLIKNFDIAAEIIKSEDRAEPNPADREVYQRLLPAYKRFYEQLMDAYRELKKA